MLKTEKKAPTEIVCEKENDWVTFECHCQRKWKVKPPANKRVVACRCKACGKLYRITIRLPRAETRKKAEASNKVRVIFSKESQSFSCRVLDQSDSGLKIEAFEALRKKLQIGKTIIIKQNPYSEDTSEFKVCWINGLYAGLHLRGQTQRFVQKFLDMADPQDDPWERATTRFL